MAVVAGAGVTLKGKDFGTDGTVNSLTVSPISGSQVASGVKQTDASGNVLFKTDTSGNLTSASVATGGVSGTTATFSGQVSANSLTVSGTLTPNGDVNVGGKLTVQKNAVINGGTQTVGLLTATGGLSSPTNGISVAGGTTTDTLSCSGNGSIGGTVSLGTTTAAALTTTGNFRSNGNLSCTSGTTTLGGPVNISGATTMAALTASSASISGNETVGGTLGVTGATTLGALTAASSSITGSETVAATLTAKNVTLTSGGGGSVTFADGTTQTTAASGSGGSATASRAVIYLGGNAHSNQPANSLWTYEFTQTDEGSTNSASARPNPGQIKMPFAFTVTGWSLLQYQARGTQTFQIVKNRNGGNLGSVVTVNAGNATVSGFPGNAFSGTFPKGSYNFAAGDSIGAVGQNSVAGASDVQLWLAIEWL